MRNRITPALDHFMRPVERCSPSQWVSRHIMLPPGKKDSKPGPVRFDKAPFLRGIIDTFADPAVTDITAVMPTRMGKTLVLRCGAAYFLAEDPSPIILFDQSIEKGRSLVQDELHTLIEHNAILRELKPRNRHHFTLDKIIFPGSTLRVYGGQSVGGAAGDTARILLCNEVEKWKGEQKGEAAMIELVRHRTESYEFDRKHFFSSTPTTEDGPIWREHMRTDQRKFFVPCPDCGGFHELTWEQVRWDEAARRDAGDWDLDRVQETARWVCPKCSSPWDDRMRRLAIEHKDADWQATAAPTLPRSRGFAVNGLYGWLPVHSIGALATDFLASRSSGFFDSRKDFWNSRMGMPWKDNAVSFDGSRIRQRIASYGRGTLPDGFVPDVIIVGYDVQTYGFPWVAFAFSWSGECRTLDHGTAANWQDLDAVQETYAKLAPRSFVIGDTNFEGRRSECLEAIFMRTARGWFAADGVQHSREIVKQGMQNPFIGSNKGYQAANAAVPSLKISTYDFKVEWEKRFTGEISTWRTYEVKPESEPKEHEEQSDYFTQLLDERRVLRKKQIHGLPRWEWKSRNNTNHFFDAHVYALALFYLLSRARTAAEKAASAAPQRTSGERRVATIVRR